MWPSPLRPLARPWTYVHRIGSYLSSSPSSALCNPYLALRTSIGIPLPSRLILHITPPNATALSLLLSLSHHIPSLILP